MNEFIITEGCDTELMEPKSLIISDFIEHCRRVEMYTPTKRQIKEIKKVLKKHPIMKIVCGTSKLAGWDDCEAFHGME